MIYRRIKNLVKQKKLFVRNWLFQEHIPATLHAGYYPAEGAEYQLHKDFGDGWQATVAYGFRYDYTWCWDLNDAIRLAEKILVKVKKDPRFLDKLINWWFKNRRGIFLKSLQDFEKKKNKLKEFSNEELLDLYKNFSRLYKEDWGLPLLTDAVGYYLEKVFSKDLQKYLGSRGKSDFYADYLCVLTAPVDYSFTTRSRLDLLKILATIKKNKKIFAAFRKLSTGILFKKLNSWSKVKKLIENHSRKYFWLNNNYVCSTWLGPDYFIEEIKHLIKDGVRPKEEQAKIIKSFVDLKKKKQKIIGEIKLPSDLVRVVKVGEKMINWQDYRKIGNMTANYYIDLFLKEVGRRSDLSFAQTKCLCPEEIELILSDKRVNREELSQRQKQFFMIFLPRGYDFTSSASEVKKIINLMKKQWLKKLSKEISGTPACVGKVKGVARIILTSDKLSRLKKGEILITGMTRPDFVAGMKRAGAIVTDEGSLTCHAAVISREFNIPCVVGAKIATKVLKDGDMVEVDAEKGVVRKI